MLHGLSKDISPVGIPADNLVCIYRPIPKKSVHYFFMFLKISNMPNVPNVTFDSSVFKIYHSPITVMKQPDNYKITCLLLMNGIIMIKMILVFIIVIH